MLRIENIAFSLGSETKSIAKVDVA